MKERAIISFLWPKNRHVLQNYLLDRPSSVLTLAGYASVEFRQVLAATVKAKVYALEGLLSDAQQAQAQNIAQQMAGAHQQYLASPAWQNFCEQRGLQADRFGGLVGSHLAERLYDQIFLVEALETAYERFDIELVVLSEDLTLHSRTLVEWAVSKGIPSLHLIHGAALINPYTVHKALNADVLAVFGARGGQAYMDQGVPAERIRLTGNPAWDVYPAGMLEKREELRLGLAAKHGWDRTAPLVVFATTWAAFLNASSRADIYEDTLRAFLVAGKVLRDKGEKPVLVVKDRPPNAAFGLETTNRLAAEIGLNPGEYFHITEDTEALVVAADALVAVDSNLLVEAMIAGTPAINLLNELGLRMGPCFDADAGILEVPPEELAETLSAVLGDAALRQALRERMAENVRHYNTGIDGKAGERVAQLMLEMVGKQEAVEAAPAAVSPRPWRRLHDISSEALQGMYHDSRRKEITAMLARPPRRVLDIGCATGSAGMMIKEQWPGTFVVGIELNQLAAEKARERLDLVISDKLEDTDLEAQGIARGSIDTVILADVLEHMYDPWSTLLRLHPYLSDDAQVLASIPNIRDLWLLNEIANGRFSYAMDGLLDITHIRFFTLSEMEKMLKETGYEVVNLGRTLDARTGLQGHDPKSTVIETNKLVIKDVTEQDVVELGTLQFLLLARPMRPLPEEIRKEVEARINIVPAKPAQPVWRKRRLAVYSSDAPIWACARLRVLEPFSLLDHEWEVVWGVDWDNEKAVVNEQAWQGADAILIHRFFSGPGTAHVVDKLFSLNVPIIYDTDDAPFDAPESRVTRKDLVELQPYSQAVLARADKVFVSTEPLREALSDKARDVQVLPNYVDLRLFAAPVLPPSSLTRIGVFGTVTHEGDFALIDGVLRQVLDKYQGKVEVIIMGMQKSRGLSHPAIRYLDFVGDYETYANQLRNLGLHFALVPLQDNAFNRSKSNIKWLEYSACGMAGIYSKAPAYHCIRHGETGLLVDNTEPAWLEAIESLIEQPARRMALAQAAQREVFDRYSLQTQVGVYAEAYRSAVERGPQASVNTRSVAEQTQQVPSDTPDTETRREGEAQTEKKEAPNNEELYALWRALHVWRDRDAIWMAERMAQWTVQPVFHLAVILPPGAEARLLATIKSMGYQLYKGWRLSIIADCEAPDGIGGDGVIHWVRAESNAMLAAANKQLIEVDANWVGMCEVGDELAIHALWSFSDAINRYPSRRAMYSDEDSVDSEGNHSNAFFKPDFDLDWLRSAPYSLGGLFVVERGLFTELGGFRSEMEGVEYWDIALRTWEQAGTEGIGHVSDVLYHRFIEGGHCRRDAEAVDTARVQVLEEHLQRSGLKAELYEGALPGTFRIKYLHDAKPLVSIIIPTKNLVEMLHRCIGSLLENTAWPNFEILVVDNGSNERETLDFLAQLRADDSGRIRVLEYNKPFNFSAMNNLAAREARGEYLLQLNNDTAALDPEWLDEMMGYAQRPDVGIVGARLILADGRLQHVGVYLGIAGEPAGHMFTHHAGSDPCYFGRAMSPQNLSAVTAACLLIRKDLYEAVGGMDEKDFAVSYNDVDLCLKVRDKGKLVVYTPYATLLHDESVSQVGTVEGKTMAEKAARYGKERAAIFHKWGKRLAFDPAYNRNLSFADRECRIEISHPLCLDPDWRPRSRIVAHPADRQGCGEYRVVAPMRALNDAGSVQGWETPNYLATSELYRFEPDSIILQRQVEWEQIEHLERYKQFSKAFRVFELDDLLTNVPIKSHQKKVFVEMKDLHKRFRKAAGLCHRFVVSTDYLAEEYKGYADEVMAVPNYVERARWGGLKSLRRQGKKPRVGWAGGITHGGDLAIIVDVVKATADEVDWIFFGMVLPELKPYLKEFHLPVVLDEYPAKLASLNLDLAVAPLEDVPFNHGKSHLRLLEYGILGLPVICTDITPYKGDYPVTRVASRYKDWVEAIRSHVADMDALAEKGDELKRYIEANWILEDHLDVWLQAWLPGDMKRA
ncbi:MAG: glycosyltransferase [Betaproteobacteria bacterium]|nr:glycosyltransferase [Betaproteobacteria bacterium]